MDIDFGDAWDFVDDDGKHSLYQIIGTVTSCPLAATSH
jgi:hypothetical protein